MSDENKIDTVESVDEKVTTPKSQCEVLEDISKALNNLVIISDTRLRTNRFFRYKDVIINVSNICNILKYNCPSAAGELNYYIKIELVSKFNLEIPFKTEDKRNSEFEDLWNFLYKEDCASIIIDAD